MAGLVGGLLLARWTGFGQASGEGDQVAASVSPSTTAAPVEVSTAGQPARGSDDAKVVLVEFMDFQCPFCKRHADQTLPRLLSEFEGKVRYVVRNLPLVIHPDAQKAAEASECAHAQGKYWEYHEVLFKNQAALDVDSLKRYARDLKLRESEFESCLDSGQRSGDVKADLDEAARVGASSTPTFFLNGRKIVGAKPYGQFKAEIEAALD